MNIYTNNTFEGFWPVGSAAVVEALNQSEAADKLNQHLVLIGLKGDAKAGDMHLFEGGVKILCDGNY